MFMSNGLAIAGPLPWLALALAGVVGVALIGEVVLRIVARRLPEPLAWHAWEAQNKVAAMQALARDGGASVVLIGASDINAGLDADAMTEMLGGDRPVFNAALNGATTRTMELWTLDVVIPLLKPDIVVVGMNTSALNDNGYGGARSAKKLRRSVGWRRAHSPKSGARRLSLFLEGSYLFRYRNFLFEPTIARRRRWYRIRRFKSDPLYLFRKRRGQFAAVSKLGMLRAGNVFSGAGYGAPERIVRVWSDQYVNDYSVGGPERAALMRLIAGARAASAEVLIVQVPNSADWITYHPHGAADFEAFTQILRSIVAETGVQFHDMNSEFSVLKPEDVFSHPIHVNFVGRRYFSELCVEQLQSLRGVNERLARETD